MNKLEEAIDNLKDLISNYKKSGIPVGGLEEVLDQLEEYKQINNK